MLVGALMASGPGLGQGTDAAGDGGAVRVPVAAVSPSAGVSNAAPAQPQNPASAKAYVVLETYCARCHQNGRTGTAFPPSGLADILHLDAIARVPSLVRPGNPDASAIYQRMFAHPNFGPPSDDRPVAEPTGSEIEAVRDWIEDLGTRRDARGDACATRGLPGGAEMATAMQRWLEQVGEAAARETRFLSVAHLQSDCATDGELAAWRQGAAQVLNGLSWSDARVRIEAVGDSLSLYAVRLSDLGWLPAHWEKLVAAYPRSGQERAAEALALATGTAVPVLPADWLASAALRAPLYYELLGLPPTLIGLGRLLGIDLAPRGVGEVTGEGVARIGLRTGAETLAPRIIERQLAKGRPFWMVHDLAGRGEKGERGDRADALDHPLAPHRVTANGRTGVRIEGSRVVFALPNGLPAFAAYDGDGGRIDRALPATARPWPEHGGRVPGLGCLGCHAAGLVRTIDEMRAHVESDGFGGDAQLREAARRLYPPASEVQRLFDDDGYSFRRAAIKAGLDPDLKAHGLGAATALARQYDLDVGLGRAAAEFGLDKQVFAERLKSFDGSEDAQILALRLGQGTLSRAEVEVLYKALRAGAGPPPSAAAVPAGGKQALPARPPLAMWTDHNRYRSGELLAVHVAPGSDCHLTLISIDPAGKATVLFPNDFDQDNLVRGGRIHRIPAKNGAYQLRLREKGVETLFAICDSRVKVPDGIEHDFERQRFTVLGNWRNFLKSVAEDGARRGGERASPARGRRVARGRNGEVRTETRSDARPEAEPRGESAAREAIQVTVD